MSFNSVAGVNAYRTVDISTGIGEVSSINDIIKEATAENAAGIATQQRDITRMMDADNLADPNALGLIQKSMLVYSNTVAFIGTAARKVVGTVETLLRS